MVIEWLQKKGLPIEDLQWYADWELAQQQGVKFKGFENLSPTDRLVRMDKLIAYLAYKQQEDQPVIDGPLRDTNEEWAQGDCNTDVNIGLQRYG